MLMEEEELLMNKEGLKKPKNKLFLFGKQIDIELCYCVIMKMR